MSIERLTHTLSGEALFSDEKREPGDYFYFLIFQFTLLAHRPEGKQEIHVFILEVVHFVF